MKPAIRGFLLLSLRTAAILVIAALALPGPVSAQTSVSGVVSASTTWTAAGSPYIVTGDVYVQGVGAPVLTIQPGVTVKFNANATLYIGYNPSGGLQAVGTAAQPILFTANTATPTPGYWRGIWLWTYAAATSQIAYATVSYGGVSNNNGGININGSSPTVSNVTVQNNIHSGITVTGGAAAISNVTSTGNQWGMVMLGTTTASVSGSSLTANTVGGVYLAAPASPSLSAMSITNNTGWAMTQDGAVTLGTVTGLTATGNTNNAIEIRASSPGANTTWKNVGLPFAVTGDVYVQGAATPVLTIQPGVTVKFNANATLYIGYNPSGGLQAVGTAAQPILFTANTATPTPGYWRGIWLWTYAAATSQIAYATVSYGGVSNNNGGININGSSPTVSNVTVQNNIHSGITVTGGAAAISNVTSTGNQWGMVMLGTTTASVSGSTLTANTVGGIYLAAPASPSLTTVSITNNTGWAMTQDGAVTLGTVTGLTATGNTNNAIEIRASTPGANTTWKNVGLPFVVTGDIYVQGAATPVLTVQPGVTVKFNANATLYIGYNPSGGLLAVGTAVQPIVFTANTATPTPGYWRGIWLWTYAAATSQIAYATVSYAGVASGAGGLHVSSTTPALLDHLNLTSNAYAGISLSGSSPRISNCNFVGNTNGIVNQSATQLIDARLNWWGSSTGPSSSGPGTGQPVTTGVKFEPWLGASSTAPQWFSSFGLGNRTFNPTLAIFANFSFQTPLSGNWTVKIFNTGNALVRTISGTGSANAASWDGKNGSGVLQPNGIYSYQVDSLAGSQGASPAVGGVVMDTTRQLAVSGFGLTPAFFSPNADGVQDTTTVSGVASFDGATWTLRVRTGGGTVVRTISGAATPTVSCVWDGRSDANAIQPEGTYTLELTVVDGSATSISSGPAVLDVTPPVSAISAPSAGATLSNVYQSGSSNVAVTGTATDTNLQAWTLEWGTGSNPSSWNSISGAATPVSSGALGSWATQANPNGSYTLRVVVNDKAGNRTTATRTLPVSNFSVSNTIYQFNGTTGGTVAYTSVVPFTLTETLFIKNAAGQTVRTIFSGSRLAGTFVDSWNGRNDANALVPDGPYFYYATATSGTSAMTWDLTNQYLNDLLIDVTGALYNNGHVVQQPFNNQPMPLTYSFGSTNRPARVWFYFSPNVGYLQTLNAMPDPSGCSIPPDFCMPAGEYQESGTFTVTWPGLDPAGVLRKDIKAIVLELRTDTFSKNAVVLFGSKPVLTNLRVDPPSYGPAGGNQVVSFDVTTYQTAPVSATVTFRNQSSMSVLRTLTAASQPPGHISIPWDGHADNGMWVAPGFYTVTLTITDPIGNQRTSQVLTDIEY